MNPLIQLKRAIPFFVVALAWLGLSPMAQALLPPPPPDGGYPNGNTAEGELALFNLTTSTGNTAVGYHALTSNTAGSFNTAIGCQALVNNSTSNGNTASGTEPLRSNATGDGNTANGPGGALCQYNRRLQYSHWFASALSEQRLDEHSQWC